MTDPLAFLPLALAAANGAIDGFESRRLVAAGVALLQRTGPLVRTLHGHRAALLLPACPQFLVALAASDGRAALLLDPNDSNDAIAHELERARVAAVFTTRALAGRLPEKMPRVLLDEAPSRATWRHGTDARDIDLTLHEGLRLEGEIDAEGAPEEVIVLHHRSTEGNVPERALTHRELLSAARAAAQSARLGRRDHTLTLLPFSSRLGLVEGLVAPLIAGGRLSTAPAADPGEIATRLEQDGVSVLVAGADSYVAIVQHLALHGRTLDAPVLQRCIVDDASIDASLQARWHALTGVEITRGDG